MPYQLGTIRGAPRAGDGGPTARRAEPSPSTDAKVARSFSVREQPREANRPPRPFFAAHPAVGYRSLGGNLLLDLGLLGRGGVGERQGHRLDRQVAALDQPFVVLLAQQRAGEANHRLVVGEDSDDVGATADLLVDALQRVG